MPAPASPPPPAPEGDPSVGAGPAPPAPGPARITVAAVDDHPMLLRGLAATFEELDGVDLVATVTCVADLLAGTGRGADVVLLDLDLGDGSNPADTVRMLDGHGLAVAVYSAFADAATVRAAIRAGALAYVAKTDQPDEVVTAIRRTADRSGWLSPTLAFLLLSDDSPDRPELSPRETEALRLYASGLSMKLVGRRMGVSQETAKQFIDRVRKKYRDVGRNADNKIALRRRAVEDGVLPPEQPGARALPGTKA